ncbi:helix-turn-helix domain-containing protein [Spirosoma spitsbergense]|uniref:helix-turn-helix domain-containing protein n=1 Tax=Spirosoma spitsbergense TaxID=431554 RepID=UPI0003785E31|nr:helix-turn-helix transcriptional regulator [Spirosoma spitsbergense]
MSELAQQVASLIREARKSKGLTQKELGEMLGIGESRVSKYESGRQNPTIATLQKIADTLNVKINLALE